jgi:4a-hydroxytetrahydrobiopterin dehydratase
VPPAPARLDDLTIQRELARLPGWSRRGDVLTKTFGFRTFPDAIGFVNRVADEAERMNHHPDLDIRYVKVMVTLSTHDAGGITQKDVDLAAVVETVAGQG